MEVSIIRLIWELDTRDSTILGFSDLQKQQERLFGKVFDLFLVTIKKKASQSMDKYS